MEHAQKISSSKENLDISPKNVAIENVKISILDVIITQPNRIFHQRSHTSILAYFGTLKLNL